MEITFESFSLEGNAVIHGTMFHKFDLIHVLMHDIGIPIATDIANLTGLYMIS